MMTLSEKYISDDDVTKYAEDELGYESHLDISGNYWENTGSYLIEQAREAMEEIHAIRILEIRDEGLAFFADEQDREEIVEMLLKGLTTDLHIDDDEIVCDYRDAAFFNEWEIKRLDDGQWLFEHNHRLGGTFCEINILDGLHIIDEVDNEFSSQLEEFQRVTKLKPIELVKLNRLITAAKQVGKIEGLTMAHEPMLRDWDQRQQVRS